MDSNIISAQRPAIHVWTIQMGKWRLAQQQDIYLLDVTAKSGNQAFAPEFAKVMEYKQGLVSIPEYTRLYVEKMRQSYRTHQQDWNNLKDRPRVAVACYCKAGVFCHRHLFVGMMERTLNKQGFDLVLHGELQ